LGLGAGFNQELSAIDNIVLYGMILGFSKKTMIEKVPEVLAYAELEKFADVPIRNFSSGMHARLAFSTAILVDPDILLLDEVLSVGDHSFRKKSRDTFMEMIERKKTVVYVSHSLNQVQQLCNRAVWLHEGQVRAIGEPETVIQEYLSHEPADVPVKKKHAKKNLVEKPYYDL
jgi:ABC-type polysaccharide/polyol phosphate transport system ATPase subunit